jgi:hypothetical protein
MNRILVFGCLIWGWMGVSAQEIGLEEAVRRGMVRVEAAAMGGHDGKCLELVVRNEGSGGVRLVVEAGLEFLSVDTTEQDLIVTDSLMVAVPSKGVRRVRVRAMCYRMRKGSPDSLDVFRLGGMSGDERMRRVAQYIARKRLHSDAGQEAIWVVSDGNSVASINHDREDKRAEALLGFVCSVTGQEVPWYRFEQANHEPGYSERIPVNVYADWSFTLTAAEKVTLGVYDSSGNLINMFFDKQSFSAGKYSFNFHFKGNGLDSGTYYCRMYRLNGGVLVERSFVI